MEELTLFPANNGKNHILTADNFISFASLVECNSYNNYFKF